MRERVVTVDVKSEPCALMDDVLKYKKEKNGWMFTIDV